MKIWKTVPTVFLLLITYSMLLYARLDDPNILYIPYFMVGGVPDPVDAYFLNPNLTDLSRSSTCQPNFRLRTGFESGIVMTVRSDRPSGINISWFGEYSGTYLCHAGVCPNEISLKVQQGLATLIEDAQGFGSLQPGQSSIQVILSLPGKNIIRGWMKVHGNLDRMNVFLFIRYKVNGKVYSEATVPAVKPMNKHNFYSKDFNSSERDRVHTSFGITNISQAPAVIKVTRRWPTGDILSQTEFILGPLTQITRRITDYEFGGPFPIQDWEGQTELESTVPILVVAFNVAQYGQFVAVPPSATK